MEEQVSTARIALKYGVLTAVVIMIFTTIINVTGLSDNKALSSLSFVFMVVGIVLAMKDFKTQNRGYISFGEGVGVGALASAVMGVLSAAFSMFYTRFIDNTMLAQALDKVREDMERRGKDDSEIDMAMEFSQKLMSPGIMFAMTVVLYVITGLVIALIVAAIVRREKPVFE
jgi:hypothetical protein